MGGRGGSLGGNHGVTAQTTTSTVPAQAAPPAPAVQQQVPAVVSAPPTGVNFPHMTQADIDAKLAEQRKLADSDTRKAVAVYTDPTPESNGYAQSQNLNYALTKGTPLTASQKHTAAGLNKIMSPIGVETTLYRADHDTFFTELGIKNYQNMSVQQLRNALVGKTWKSKSFTSTAHDSRKNPFWPGGYMSGNREVLIRYHTSKTLKCALVQQSQSEVLLAPNSNFRITGIRNSQTGNSKTYKKGLPVMEVLVEVW